MKSVHFSVDLAFKITLKQHTNYCNQSQTDKCRNNHQWLSLDFDCRQTSAISTDKTFAVCIEKLFSHKFWKVLNEMWSLRYQNACTTMQLIYLRMWYHGSVLRWSYHLFFSKLEFSKSLTRDFIVLVENIQL